MAVDSLSHDSYWWPFIACDMVVFLSKICCLLQKISPLMRRVGGEIVIVSSQIPDNYWRLSSRDDTEALCKDYTGWVRRMPIISYTIFCQGDAKIITSRIKVKRFANGAKFIFQTVFSILELNRVTIRNSENCDNR